MLYGNSYAEECNYESVESLIWYTRSISKKSGNFIYAKYMKTPREMYNKLRRLETEIFQKNRKLRNLHTRHIINSQGNNRFVPERVNKNTYTNDQYMKNIQNAVRITFNELRPLIKEYNKRAKKYREIMGLPVMEKRGSWPEQLAFVRTKNSRNGPLPNVKNLYRKYAHIVTSGFSGIS